MFTQDEESEDFKFHFGKYNNLSFFDVYQGNSQINQDLLDAFVKEKITVHESEIHTRAISTKVYSFESIKGFLYIKSTSVNLDVVNLEEVLNSIFKENDNWYKWTFKNLSLDEFNKRRSDEGKYPYSPREYDDGKPIKWSNEKLILVGGNPEYIDWCILNVYGFYLTNEIIQALEIMPINKYIGLKFTKIKSGIYEYKPCIESQFRKFGGTVLEKNQNRHSEYLDRIEEDVLRRAEYEDKISNREAMDNPTSKDYENWYREAYEDDSNDF